MTKLWNSCKGDSNPGSLDWESSILPLSYHASLMLQLCCNVIDTPYTGICRFVIWYWYCQYVAMSLMYTHCFVWFLIIDHAMLWWWYQSLKEVNLLNAWCVADILLTLFCWNSKNLRKLNMVAIIPPIVVMPASGYLILLLILLVLSCVCWSLNLNITSSMFCHMGWITSICLLLFEL